MKKHLIFDFDGVIADTAQYHHERIQKWIAQDISLSQFREAHTGNIYAEKANPAHELDWKAYFGSMVDDIPHLQVFEGMREVLAVCDSVDIITSCSEEIVDLFAKQKDLAQYISGIYGVETAKSKEEKFLKVIAQNDLAKEDVLFVTDTLGDVLEAENQDIETIAVSWGFHPRSYLERSDHATIVDTISALEQEIQKVLCGDVAQK